MPRLVNKPASVFIQAAIVSTAFVLGMAGFGDAPALAKKLVPTTREVILASASQALTYCQSGKMPSGDIAYVSGGPGLVQYGPDQNCTQQVAKKITISKAIQVVGSRVSECTLASATKAIQFCQSGTMGEWDIDYISGKVGRTINGPGYGCNVNKSTSSIGNAVCR